MAYSATGTAGNDTLNQSGDAGPGSIVGFGGNDSILAGSGPVTVDAGSGQDTVLLQTGNTGMVSGETGNDSIWDTDTDIGSMILFGNQGGDTIMAIHSTNPLTILGGNNSADGDNSIRSGSGADVIFGHGGNDILVTSAGNDTMVAGFGDDEIAQSPAGFGTELIFANEGNDTITLTLGNDTVFAGQGNDSALIINSGGIPLYFMNEGNDTVDAGTCFGAMMVMGGHDSNDGSDSIITGTGADFVFGNGGNDTIRANEGGDTVVGGVGNDSLQCTGNFTDLMFANEGDDTVQSASGADTIFGGQGNDQISGGATGGQLLIGGEGNDTVTGLLGIDTLSGGKGADLFFYFSTAAEDGDNANGGGPVEQITDVNFDEDRFRVLHTVGFALNVGAVAGADLEASAQSAIQASLALGGGGAQHVAAQFTFNGRSYLAIDQGGVNSRFTDASDFLFDITGVTGTIGANDFIT